MGVRKVENILPTPRNVSVHHHQLPLIYDSTWVNNNISAPRLCFDASAPRFQRKDAFTSCFKRNSGALSPHHLSVDHPETLINWSRKTIVDTLYPVSLLLKHSYIPLGHKRRASKVVVAS